MTVSDESHPIHHPGITSRTFDGETVIVDPERNVVRMLNQVGSRIWDLADGTRTPREIAVELSKEYDVQLEEAEQSVLQFITELAEKDLLALRGK